MADWTPILWSTKATKDRSGLASSEDMVNWFWEVNPQGSKTPGKIVYSPGLKFFGVYGSGPIRGIWPHLGKLLVVSGAELYVVSSDASSVMIGAVAGSGPVAMCSNNTHVAIATNLGLYAATLAAIALVDGNYYTSATYQDGYGIFTLANSDQFYVSGIDDLTTVSPLDFTSVDTFPDNVLCGVSLNRQLTMFGETAVERYYNNGDPYFPFARIVGGTIQIGCLAAKSPYAMQDVIGWLANDYSVRLLIGNSHKIVSTPGVEKWIKERLQPSAAVGMSYRQEGHEFYVLNFSDGSIAVDIVTGLWHERKSWLENRWRVDTYAKAFNLDLAGDFENGNIYQIDLDTPYDENGSGVKDWLVRTMKAPPISNGPMRTFCHEVYLDCETGVGNAVAPGQDPQYMLDWSDDGGKTWSNPQRFVPAGAIGQYTRRLKVSRLGSFFSRIFRLSIADPVKSCVLGAYARMDIGNG